MGKEVNNCPCELPSSNATATSTGVTRRKKQKHGYPVEVARPEDPETTGCSGKSCQSCTAAVIADCVAVCCCPCAVVNIFALTFFKLPWMMCRKCLNLGNKKKKLKNNGKDQSVISRKDEGLETKSESLLAEEEKEQESAKFEAEKVWLELYKVDQLGFGRVSFTGNE